MRRTDWTPVVLITSTVCLTVVTVVLLTSPRFRLPFTGQPGPTRARHRLPDRVVVWVGEIAPGLKAVLAPVWGEDLPDRAHDRTLNEGLGLTGEDRLAFERLLVFNPTQEEHTLTLETGALVLRGDGTDPPSRLVSVADLVGEGRARPSPALRTVLEGCGTLRRRIVLPPGRMADLIVAFSRQVDLGAVRTVTTAKGRAFERRPKTRRELETLMLRPEAADVEDL
ncbi:MAG: hypothetical protein ACC662_06190 [Planctomycetota bacterium]